MPKIRVHELAKELGKSSKDVIYALKRHGVDVESHTSMISSENAEKIRNYFGQPKGGRPAAKAQNQAESRAENRAENQAESRTENRAENRAENRVQNRAEGRAENPTENRTERKPENKTEAVQTSAQKPESRPAAGDAGDRAENKSKSISEATGKQKAQAGPSASGTPGGQPETAGSRSRQDPSGREAGSNDRGGERAAHTGSDRNGSRTGSVQEEHSGMARRTEGRTSRYSESRGGESENRENRSRYSGNRSSDGRSSENRSSEYRGSRYNSERSGESRTNRYSENRGGESENRENRSRYSNDRGGENRSSEYRGSRYNNDRNGESRTSRYSENRGGESENRENRSRYSNDRGSENRGRYNNDRGDGTRQERSSSRGRSDRDSRFNLDSAINKEVVVTKDTSRENRRNYKDTRDKEKGTRERENEKKPGKGRTNTQGKKPVMPPVKPKPVVEKVTSIVLPETITLKELGDKMKVSSSEIIKKLFLAGKVLTLNSEISYEEAEEIALDYDILCEHEVVVDVIEEMLREEEEDENNLVTRPPVVCVMGHVDHGKTSILDAIRKTSVTAGEAGGITQHIGAYVVDVDGSQITFLDTPGHEAFTAMRLRGAQSTDIAILVVAADDGVMPQTIEAINHAKAAGIDIIVAINKIDKPGANVDRVKQELTEYELLAEDWGGQTIMVPVSAHTGEGLQDLLDMILLVAEMRELKANPNRKARGLVLEAQLDKGRGPVATVLVQKGTLKVGDNVTVGTAYGKVRAMIDDKSRRVKEAGPSMPVEILGLNDVPQAGEVFLATNTEKEARAMAETFIASNREKLLADTRSKLSLEGLFDQIQAGQVKELNIVVKADVQGSVEAVKQSLVKLSNDEVAVKVIHGAVGAINESDVTLAAASNAIIIGFNVRPDNVAKAVAEQENVDMRLYRVIYNAIEDVEAAMKGMLDPTYEEKIIGHAEVRKTYKVSGVGTVIGGYVLDGKVQRSCKCRLLRDNVIMYEGELASLKRFKEDVREVNAGYECGMSLEKFNDVKEGDQIEMFVMEEVAR